MSASIEEHDYIGIGMGMSEANMACDMGKNKDLNLKATELRLGLPGSESPERDGAIKNPVAGAKRGFSDTINGAGAGAGGSGKWVFSEVDLVKNNNSGLVGGVKENGVLASPKPKPALIEKKPQVSAPASKQQVVGWPPIRSFRKNTMGVRREEEKSKYVKVSMDGAPYLRKVDLEMYSTYLDLSSALEKMFSCFTIGQFGSHGAPTRDGLSESRLMDLLHGSEYVLTYEDKDGDWMLVGDVPWDPSSHGEMQKPYLTHAMTTELKYFCEKIKSLRRILKGYCCRMD